MIKLTFNSAACRKALAKTAKAIASDTERALDSALTLAQRYARASDKWKSRTGTLRNSIGRAKESQYAGIVVANAPYATYLENGTRAHDILPRNGKFLRFRVNGATVFSRGVKHPGTKATHFMQDAVQYAAPFLRRDVETAVRHASHGFSAG